jgi:hypothetical protein
MTLKRLIDGQGFPAGRLITPNARAWSEDEVDAWIATRPAARKQSGGKSRSAAQPAAVLCDETAFWPTGDSANPDVEVIKNAVRP